jgi:hypothetical protein
MNNRRKIADLFLFVYISFLVAGIFHYHTYDLDNSKKFDLHSDETPLTSLDLTDGSHSPCLLNSFSGTILNYSFSSLGIIKPLTQSLQTFSVEDQDFHSNPQLNNLSLRAPPAIS